MKVAILILALLSALAYGQTSTLSFNIGANSGCNTPAGCNLGDILTLSSITALINGGATLDFTGAGSGLNVNIAASGIAGLTGSAINFASLIVTGGQNTVTIAASTTVQTANFTVASSSNVIVNGVLQVQAASAAAGAFIVDASSALYVSAQASVTANINIVAQGTANVAGTVSTTGAYTQSAGNLILNSTGTTQNTATAYVYSTQSVSIASGATLSGNGVIGGATAAAAIAVSIDGTVNIGNSPGVVTINGDWRPSKTSTFNLEVQSASQFDKLFVTGKAYPNGFLRVTLLNSYSPAANTKFAFVTAGNGVDGSFFSTTGTSSSTVNLWTSQVNGNNIYATFNSAVSVAVSGFVLIACVLASMM